MNTQIILTAALLGAALALGLAQFTGAAAPAQQTAASTYTI